MMLPRFFLNFAVYDENNFLNFNQLPAAKKDSKNGASQKCLVLLILTELYILIFYTN